MKLKYKLNEAPAKYDDKKMLKKLKEVFSKDKFIKELVKDIRIDKKDKPIVCLTVGETKKDREIYSKIGFDEELLKLNFI